MRLSSAYLAGLFLILVSLSGCSLFTPKEKLVYQNTNVFIPVFCPTPIKPQSVKPKPLHPTAVQDQANVWWVGFTPSEYGNLAINTEESIRFIKDQNGVIAYYRTCIDDFNQIVDDKNDNSTGDEAAPTGEEI